MKDMGDYWQVPEDFVLTRGESLPNPRKLGNTQGLCKKALRHELMVALLSVITPL